MASFRYYSHDLMIEHGSYYMLLIEDRICAYCEHNIENEFHFDLKCPLYNAIRLNYLNTPYVINESCEKLCNRMYSSYSTVIRNLAM